MHADLLDLRVILGEDEAGVGVAEDVGDVRVVGGRVDRRGGASGQHDAVVGQDPVRLVPEAMETRCSGSNPNDSNPAAIFSRVVVGLLPGQ